MTSRRPSPDADDETLLALVADMLEHADPVPPGLADAAWAQMAAQPIEYTVRRFNCPFCRRYSRSSRKPVADHMARCWRNPAVRSCITCRSFEQERAEPEVGVDALEWCRAQDVELERIVVHCPLWALRGESS